MAYQVRIKKQELKKLSKLPQLIQEKFRYLIQDFKYHCHLNYSYVACWTYRKDEISIEVYYVGSRQSAPY